MPSWKGKTRGGVTGYKLFILILQTLGLGFAYFVLRFVVVYFLFSSPAAFKSQYKYFRDIHHFSPWKSFCFIIRNYYVFGQILLDKLALLSGVHNKLTFDFDGEEYLRQMKDGGLLVSAHVGNWEIAGQLLNRLDKKVNILMLDAEHQHIKKYLSGVLSNRNVNFIVIKEDYSHFKEIEAAYLNKEIIAMHGDRFIEGNMTMTMEFLGRQARFPTGPFTMAWKFGMPVSIVFALKESSSHYHFYASPAFTFSPSRSMRQTEIERIIGKYVIKVEEMVKKYPEQWFNYYDFWEERHGIRPNETVSLSA